MSNTKIPIGELLIKALNFFKASGGFALINGSVKFREKTRNAIQVLIEINERQQEEIESLKYDIETLKNKVLKD